MKQPWVAAKGGREGGGTIKVKGLGKYRIFS